MILKKVEVRRNPKAWHGSRLTVSGLHGHPSTPNPRPKRRVETPGDPWGVSQPPGPSSPAYGTPPTANGWFLPLSSSQWGQTLPTTSVMFPVRIAPRGHAQGGKKIPGPAELCPSSLLFLLVTWCGVKWAMSVYSYDCNGVWISIARASQNELWNCV